MGEAVSTHRHDYAEVENCPNHSAVDGGPARGGYQRYAGKDMTLIDVKQEDGSWELEAVNGGDKTF